MTYHKKIELYEKDVAKKIINNLMIYINTNNFEEFKTVLDQYKEIDNLLEAKIGNVQNNLFHEACRSGNVEFVQYMLPKMSKNTIESKNSLFTNALMFSVMSGNIKLIDFIIDKNWFNIKENDLVNRSILFYAVQSGSIDVLQKFIDMGFDIHHKDQQNSNLMNVVNIFSPSSLTMLQFLHSIDIDFKNIKKSSHTPTLLFEFCESGAKFEQPVFDYLVKHIDLLHKNSFNRNVLEFSVFTKNISMLEKLLKLDEFKNLELNGTSYQGKNVMVDFKSIKHPQMHDLIKKHMHEQFVKNLEEKLVRKEYSPKHKI